MIDGLIRSRHIVHYIVYMTQATISILHYALCIMYYDCRLWWIISFRIGSGFKSDRRPNWVLGKMGRHNVCQTEVMNTEDLSKISPCED